MERLSDFAFGDVFSTLDDREFHIVGCWSDACVFLGKMGSPWLFQALVFCVGEVLVETETDHSAGLPHVALLAELAVDLVYCAGGVASAFEPCVARIAGSCSRRAGSWLQRGADQQVFNAVPVTPGRLYVQPAASEDAVDFVG